LFFIFFFFFFNFLFFLSFFNFFKRFFLELSYTRAIPALSGQKVQRNLYQGINEQFLEEMNIEQIAEILQYLYFQAIKSDLLKEQIEKIEEVIQACAEIALTSGLFFSSQSVIEELKNVLGIVEKKENEEDNDFAQDLAKIAVFIIFNGLLFHQVISSLYSKINGLHRAPEVNILNFVKQEWKKIMRVCYYIRNRTKLPLFSILNSFIDFSTFLFLFFFSFSFVLLYIYLLIVTKIPTPIK
jgi:hypothetical protein